MNKTVFRLLLLSALICLLISCDATQTLETASEFVSDDIGLGLSLNESSETTNGKICSSEASTPVENSTEEESVLDEYSEEDFSRENSPGISSPTDSSGDEQTKMNTNISDSDGVKMLQTVIDIACEYYDVSVYYCDTETGYYFYHTENESYPCASTIKAIYCHYLIQAGTDLSQRIVLDEVSQSSTSGNLTEDSIGCSFTVRELIQFSIVCSDNMAYKLLYKTFGRKGFNEYIQSIGLECPKLSSSSEYCRADARSMGICLLEIYRYSVQNNDMFLIDLMKSTTYNKQIGAGTDLEIAHKFGYEGGNYGYHDMAIVYAQEPYILSIFTREDANDKDSNIVFVKISELVEELHDLIHA